MKHTMKRRLALLSATLLAATGLAACGGGSSSDGKTVTVWSSVDAPVQAGLQKALEAKVKGDGIKINWETVKDINTLIMTKITAGDTPDIAFIPQPGVVKDIVAKGAAYPIDFLDAKNTDSMVPGSLDAGSVDGKVFGLLVSMNVKGLVWYPKTAWDKAGYKVPATIDELNTLSTKIADSGTTPWCFGIQSDGGSTGWPATDWLETLVMKYGGAQAYNDWVSHKTPFDSDVVKQAGAEMEKLLLADGMTFGGRKAIAATAFGTAGNQMFEAKPGCFMLNQGSFITGFFPEDVQKNLDKEVGVFGFPPATAGGENPVEGGGDMAVMMSDSDNTKKVMGYLSETDIGNDAAATSSFISPHTDFDVALYPNQTTKDIADVAYKASSFLFDGSDQMPGAVGAGTFWSEMTNWISGQSDLETALKNIDSSWPS